MRILVETISIFLLLTVGCIKFAPLNCSTFLDGKNNIIINISTDNAMLVDTGLQGNYIASLKQMISENVESTLSDLLAESIKSRSIIVSKDKTCSQSSILLEGNLASLTLSYTKKFRQKYSGTLKAKIIDCDTNTTLYTENIFARNGDFEDTPKEIGEDFAKHAYNTLNKCK